MCINNPKEYIKKVFSDNGIVMTDDQSAMFFEYYNMLVEKNKVMNLTAITEFTEVVRKHFLDSILNVEIPKGTKTVIDIGTGAGFPGIPLKIMYPELEITLFDSLNKRLVFLEEVINKLNLKNIATYHGRAEDGARNISLREKFDLVVSRAVANLSTLSEYCVPYVKVGGYFLSYKGDGISEIEEAEYAMDILGCDKDKRKVIEFELPDFSEKRTLIYLYKKKHTPKAYPRKAGVPSKQPLRK